MGSIRCVIIFVSALLFVCPTHLGADAKIPENEPNALMVEPCVCQAGTVIEGDPLQCICTVVNRGKTPLAIKAVVPSCRCTSADFDGIIPAGGNGDIRLRVKTGGYRGEKVFTAKIITDATDREPVEVSISGTIIPAITVSSDRVFFNGFVGDKHIDNILIRYNKGQADCLTVRSVGLEAHATCRLAADAGENTVRLTIENIQHVAGSYRGRLVMETGLAERPVIVIPVMARLMADMQIFPASPIIDTGLSRSKSGSKGSEGFSRRLPGHGFVFIRCNRGRSFAITSVEYDRTLISADITPMNRRTAYRLEISPAPSINRDSPTGETRLVIHTDYPGYEKMDVPVVLK